MYKILIGYTTGDSFHTKDTETVLDGTWKDLGIVKRKY